MSGEYRGIGFPGGSGRPPPPEIFSIDLAIAKSFCIAFSYQYCITIKQHATYMHTHL